MIVDREHLLDLCRCMVKIRAFEDTAHTTFLSGDMPGFLHFVQRRGSGGGGLIAVLRDDDFVTRTTGGTAT